ncbi:hypothetical protein ACFPTO_13355 [Paraburkholderia denitrificans]|uniref:Uncharacterized protein n=1 Tax=Paraburkholderia denitrificans TaxID=694025 RepID=A0ABW0J9K9_9BURK
MRYLVASWQNLSNLISRMECDGHVQIAPSLKLLDKMKRIDDAKQSTARGKAHCSLRGNA